MNVLTLVHGRHDHLANLIRGLERSVDLPQALVIVQMNEEQAQWQSSRFSIIHCMVRSANDALPLAAARNQAVLHAPSNDLIFLDVDCIPDRWLVTRYRAALAQHKDAVLQGETLYLPPGVAGALTSNEDLIERGATHPVHREYSVGDLLPHHLFWSLNFSCRRETFERIGGFDERYEGYGGEDTDFAFKAAKSNVPIRLVAATAFHQFHPSYDPPLNHLRAIVANAHLFRKRWGIWPMEGWLRQFADAGYINFDRDTLDLIRMPSVDEINRCEIKGTDDARSRVEQ
ncbi:glycosyltransferase family 2 protein [Caballeronia insecticola]|uniref:glycosyltransferase family 2 protein n=1 Tax=Caballeronia insecticola TaxID=758793 RepID=UPI0005C5D4D0|nr:galactosyltransferase-related protein [Caballeronia insecticola]